MLLGLVAGGCGDDGGEADNVGTAADDEHGHEEETGSHTPDAGPPPFADADVTTEVSATLRDYAFSGVPDVVAGPNVRFVAKIAGSNTHELEVLDAGGEPLGEIPAFKGSETKTLALVLEPGTYSIQCLVKEGARSHAQLGMRQTLTVS